MVADKHNALFEAAELGLSHNSLPVTQDSSSGYNSSQEKEELACDDEYPEGGWDAWQQVAAGFIAQSMTWGYPTTFGIYQLYYTDTLNLPNAQVSWIGSIQTFFTYIMCVVAGRLADAGYQRSTVLVGSFLAVFGAFMTSIATEFWQILLAQGICQGAGMGIFYMPTVSVVSSYFQRRRALAICICATGPAVGGVVFPAIVQYLVPQIGFPWASRCAAFVMLVFLIALNLLFKPRPLSPAAAAAKKAAPPAPWIDWTAFTEKTFVLMTLGCWVMHLSLYFVTSYINSYSATTLNFDGQQAVALLLIMNAASGPGRLLIGFVADRWTGALNGLIFSVAAMGVMIYAWAAVVSAQPMYAYATFFGVVLGLVSAGFASSLAVLGTDPKTFGVRFGMTCALLGFATLAGPPIAGSIIDRGNGNYLGVQIYGGTICMVGATILAMCRISVTGLKFWAKI